MQNESYVKRNHTLQAPVGSNFPPRNFSVQREHALVLHVRFSSPFPAQCLPPHRWIRLFCLFLICRPPPHKFVHLDHPPQFDHEQSTGQQPLLQICDSNGSPLHSSPPQNTSTERVRDLIRDPLPQDLVQEVHSLHTPQLQLTGQQTSLHFFDSVKTPAQGIPPQETETW